MQSSSSCSTGRRRPGAVAAMAAGHPGRFAGVAAVDLARPMDAVRGLFLHGNAERVFGLGQGPAGITG